MLNVNKTQAAAQEPCLNNDPESAYLWVKSKDSDRRISTEEYEYNLALSASFQYFNSFNTQCHRQIFVRTKKVFWLFRIFRSTVQLWKDFLKILELGYSLLQTLVLLFFSVPMTSCACCSTGVGEVHVIGVNNSLVKVKVITVGNN